MNTFFSKKNGGDGCMLGTAEHIFKWGLTSDLKWRGGGGLKSLFS